MKSLLRLLRWSFVPVLGAVPAAGTLAQATPPPVEPEVQDEEATETERRGPWAHLDLSDYNVIFYISDQHRYDAMGCAGDPVVQTPNLDRLATEGMRLDHMYSQFPLCGPSRACFTSGQYPRANRVRYNGIPTPLEVPRLSRTLRKYGWKTAVIGNGDSEPKNAEIAGYDVYRIQNDYYPWARENGIDGTTWFATGMGDMDLGGHRYGTLDYASEFHFSTWIANNVCELMEEWKDERFYLWVGDRMPHPPYLVPTDYEGMYSPDEVPMAPSIPREGALNFEELKQATANYYSLISLVDTNLGRILDKLDELGIADKTIVIYSTDHGNLLGHHGALRKAMLYDDDARLPFLIRYPGQTQSGVVIDGMAEQIDMAPTVLDLLGVPVPRGVQGTSMVPMLRGEAPGKSAVFGDVSYERRGRQMIRTKDYKLIYSPGEGNLLFDMQADPWEMNNLYDDVDHLAVRTDLLGQLLYWNVHTVDTTFPDLHRNPGEAAAFLKRFYHKR